MIYLYYCIIQDPFYCYFLSLIIFFGFFHYFSLILHFLPFHHYLFLFDFKYFAHFLVDYFGSIFQAVDLLDSIDDYSCSVVHFALPVPEIPLLSKLILPSYLAFEELYFLHYLPGGVHQLNFLFSYLLIGASLL